MGIAGLLLLVLGNSGCRTLPPEAASLKALEAREALELERRATAYAHFAAGVVQEIDGNSPAALEEFYQAAEADPFDAELLFDVSGRLIEGRQFSQALAVLNQAVSLPEVDGMVFVRLGFVHAQLGNPRKAAEANEIAVRRLPRFMPARQNLYVSQVQARKPEAAWAVLAEAARLPQTDAEFLINLAELFSDYGRQFPDRRDAARGKAVEVLDRARESVSGPQTLKLADGYYLLGETDKAARAYLDFLEHEQVSSALRDVLRVKLTDIYLRKSDRARAVEQLTAMVRENPANAGAHYFLGAIALEEKRWDDAVASYRRALQIRPDFEPAQLDLATAQIAAGRPGEGLLSLEQLRRTKPGSFTVEYLSGLACQELKNYPQALAHLATAESLARNQETNRLTTAFYFQLGVAADQAGNRNLAAGYFEKSIALAPDNAEALNYLGYLWTEQGENLPRARVLIERALKLEPDNDAFLDSMGWVLFRLGDNSGALEYLQKSIAKLEAPDATVYDHLGDVYFALKQLDQAREAWAKSLAIESSDRVQKKLDELKNR